MPSGVTSQRSVARSAATAVRPQEFFCSFERGSCQLFGSSFARSIARAVHALRPPEYLGPAYFWSGVTSQRSVAQNAATAVRPQDFFCSFERGSFKLFGSSFARSIARAVHALRLAEYLAPACFHILFSVLFRIAPRGRFGRGQPRPRPSQPVSFTQGTPELYAGTQLQRLILLGASCKHRG